MFVAEKVLLLLVISLTDYVIENVGYGLAEHTLTMFNKFGGDIVNPRGFVIFFR